MGCCAARAGHVWSPVPPLPSSAQPSPSHCAPSSPSRPACSSYAGPGRRKRFGLHRTNSTSLNRFFISIDMMFSSVLCICIFFYQLILGNNKSNHTSAGNPHFWRFPYIVLKQKFRSGALCTYLLNPRSWYSLFPVKFSGHAPMYLGQLAHLNLRNSLLAQ